MRRTVCILKNEKNKNTRIIVLKREREIYMRQYKKLWAILTLLCFSLTFLPVAAFAKDFSAENCYVYTVDKNVSAQINEAIDFSFDFDGATTKSVYVWFIKKDSSNLTPTTSATVTAAAGTTGIRVNETRIPGVYQLTGDTIHSGDKFQVKFDSANTYTIAAAASDPYIAGKTIAECIRYASHTFNVDREKNVITVENDMDSKNYTLQLVDNAGLPFDGLKTVTLNEGQSTEMVIKNAISNSGNATIGAGNNLFTEDIPGVIKGVNNHLNPNGVASNDITFKVLDEKGEPVKGRMVKLSTSNTNCQINKESVETNTLGQFSFNITLTEESPNTDGFTVYIESGAYEAKLQVTASSNGAHSLAITKDSKVAVSTDDVTKGSTIADYLWIAVKDVNGNFVKPFSLQPGGKFLEPGFAGVKATIGKKTTFASQSYKDKSYEDYVSVVSKPAGSKLENKDVWLCPVGQDAAFQNTLYFNEDLIAGEYTFKINLSSGKYINYTLKVAEMGTPIKLTITPKAPVTELGGSTSASFSLVDADGVTAKALPKGTDVAVSGYAVASTEIEDNTLRMYMKDDEKYLGNEFKIVATNDRYNLVGESTLQVTSGKAGIVWMEQTAPINTPTDITYILMDQGKMMNVTIGGDESTLTRDPKAGDFKLAAKQTGFVVVTKPEGATVNFDARAAGGAATSFLGDCYAVGRIESDKPGVVTVKMSLSLQIRQEDGSYVSRVYEGTQNILFTDGKTGKNVIMSIGSDEAVINGGKTAMDASPIIKDNRTFVPFRALAEAFGADVAYDEATKSVTAELNGVKVVMIIGSSTYTVDGKEKTADVAPYVSNGRTMVPVRFAAEAFGSKVIPTYDDKGGTADILFTL